MRPVRSPLLVLLSLILVSIADFGKVKQRGKEGEGAEERGLVVEGVLTTLF